MIDKSEVDVMGCRSEQGSTYVHEYVEQPSMEEGDTSVANSVTVQLGIVISHKGNTDSQADKKQEEEGGRQSQRYEYKLQYPKQAHIGAENHCILLHAAFVFCHLGLLEIMRKGINNICM